jgi:hypothetical protein
MTKREYITLQKYERNRIPFGIGKLVKVDKFVRVYLPSRLKVYNHDLGLMFERRIQIATTVAEGRKMLEAIDEK